MLEKQYLKSKDIRKVTFYIAPELKAAKVALAGDFNKWSKVAAHGAMIGVADKYVPNPFISDYSIVEA